jgi:hypothetical protein
MKFEKIIFWLVPFKIFEKRNLVSVMHHIWFVTLKHKKKTPKKPKKENFGVLLKKC